MPSNHSVTVLALVAVSVMSMGLQATQTSPPTPAATRHEQHSQKEADLKEHGRMAMGFDQDKAPHHFTLTANGGTIAVTADDPSDTATRDRIQAHLKEIAEAFGTGDFEKPLMTHAEMPPGVAAMQQHKADLKYTFEPTARGGMVRIATSNDQARKAVHEFLRYQIREHATGDPVAVKKSR